MSKRPAFGIWKDNPVCSFDPTRSAANPDEAFQQVVRDIHSNTRDLTEEQYLDVLRRTIRYLKGIERTKE